MKKKDALKAWAELAPNQDIVKHFRPIPYRTVGSTYGACGIRIDGSPEFVNAVLSRLQDLLQLESGETRLSLARSEVKSDGKHNFSNREAGAEVCYIRCHERGPQARYINMVYGKGRNICG